jgi:hypothetical protein
MGQNGVYIVTFSILQILIQGLTGNCSSNNDKWLREFVRKVKQTTKGKEKDDRVNSSELLTIVATRSCVRANNVSQKLETCDQQQADDSSGNAIQKRVDELVVDKGFKELVSDDGE